MTMPCDDARAALDARPHIGHAERAALDAHLETCAACRAVATLEERITAAFALAPSLAPSPRLTAALAAVPGAERDRRAWAVAPLAWGSLAALAVLGLAGWLARAPAPRANGPTLPPPAVATIAAAGDAGAAASRRAAVVASGTATTPGRPADATSTPTGPLAAVATLIRPLFASPTTAALALAPAGRGDGGRGAPPRAGAPTGTAADLAGPGGDRRRPDGPTPTEPGAKIGDRPPGAATSPPAPTGPPPTPEAGRSMTPGPGPTEDPALPPGIAPIQTGTAPPTGTPGQDLPPPIGTPSRPEPPPAPSPDPGAPPSPATPAAATPSPSPSPTATATATATPTPTGSATATPRPTPTP